MTLPLGKEKKNKKQKQLYKGQNHFIPFFSITKLLRLTMNTLNPTRTNLKLLTIWVFTFSERELF